MSERRKAGDIVRKAPNAGFLGETGGLWQIQPEDDPWSCVLECGDPECSEWATLWEVDAAGKPTGKVACHVSECEMLNADAEVEHV